MRNLIVCIAVFLMSCTHQNISPKEFSVDDLTYKIKSNELISIVEKYDSLYSDLPEHKDRGLSIYHIRTFRDSTIYGISYASGITDGLPFILCEPINDKPVRFVPSPANGLFSLKPSKSAKIQRHLSPDEYLDYIDAVKLAREDIRDGSIYDVAIEVTLDTRSWHVVVDNYSNRIIRVDTTGRAGMKMVHSEL